MPSGGFVPGGGGGGAVNALDLLQPCDNIRLLPLPPPNEHKICVQAYASGSQGEIQFAGPPPQRLFEASHKLVWHQDSGTLEVESKIDVRGPNAGYYVNGFKIETPREILAGRNILVHDSTNNPPTITVSAYPTGSNGEIQFAKSGFSSSPYTRFEASNRLKWDETQHRLELLGDVNIASGHVYRINGIPLAFDATQIHLNPAVATWTTVQNAITAIHSDLTTLARGMAYVGHYDATTNVATFVPSMSSLDGPLPAANAAGIDEGDYLVVTTHVASGPLGPLNVGDQLISGGSGGGANWIVLPIGANLASVTAATVPLSPMIGTWNTVQDAVTSLNTRAAPAGAIGQIQFHAGGTPPVFGASSNLYWDNSNQRLGIGTATPAYALDVGGDYNLHDPALTGLAYRINGIPLATGNADGTTINLTNVSNVNGQPYGPAGSTGQVQFNAGGTPPVFGASTNLFWDNTNSRLGVNTATPAYALDVAGDANVSAGNSYRIGGTLGLITGNADATYGAAYGYLAFGIAWGGTPVERMRINYLGHVGILTASPQTALEVNGMIRPTAGAYAAPTSGSGIEIHYYNGGAIPEGGVIWSRSRGPTVNRPLYIDGNPLIFNEAFGVADVYIGAGSANVAVPVPKPHGQTFDVTIGRAGGANFTRLNLLGNTPSAFTVTSHITFSNDWIAGNDKRIAQIEVNTETAFDSGNIAFRTANAGVMAERMRITSTGNVGIGTATPAYTLDVAGDYNLHDPALTGLAYRINGIPLATGNADGTTINLTNVSNVNGQPYGPAGAVGQIQYNAGGTPPVFGASANLLWANNRLGIWTTSALLENDIAYLRVNGAFCVSSQSGNPGDRGLYMWYVRNDADTTQETARIVSTRGVLLIDSADLTVGIMTNGRRDLPYPRAQWNDVRVPIGYGSFSSYVDLIGAQNVSLIGPLGGITFNNWTNPAADKRAARFEGGLDGAADSGYLSLQTAAAGTLTERMRITSTGHVGIGTATPQAKLDLGASGGALAPLADLAFSNAQIAATEKRVAIIQARTDTSIDSGVLTFQTMFVGGTLYENMRINSRGFVGIGTQVPQVRCEVNGLLRTLAVGAGSLVFPTSGKGLEIYYWDAGAGNETGVIECRNRTGGVNMPFAIRGNPLAFNQFGGNVGIGTGTPQATLDVGGGGVSAIPRIYLSGNQNQPDYSVGQFAFLNIELASADKRLASIETWTGNPVSSGILTFSTANAGVLAERMRIDSQGNVGIGTATPTSRLSIVGLPTSAAGLAAGDVWNNGGVLNIV